MGGVQLQEARRDGILFYRSIDGGEDDHVFLRHLNDYAAASEAGDDFVFALKILSGGTSGEQLRRGEENRERGAA